MHLLLLLGLAAQAGGVGECGREGALERQALEGGVDAATEACLERLVGDDADPAARDAASKLLIQQAWAKSDWETWRARVARHRASIDADDPELALQLARHALTQQRDPDAAVAYAEEALASAWGWAEKTRATKLATVHEVRARAGETLWRSLASQLGGTVAQADRMRLNGLQARVRLYAVDWLRAAREAESETEAALALCVSTGWEPFDCEKASRKAPDTPR